MVDAQASFDESALRAPGRQARSTRSAFRFACEPVDACLSAYRELAADAVFAPPQSPLWVECWARRAAEKTLLATASCDGRPLAALAVELVRRRGIIVARFMGGHHANGNFPMIARGIAPADREIIARGLVSAIAQAHPGCDLVALERQADRLRGEVNPFSVLPRSQSPNPSLAVDLSGGFDAVLERSSAKRKRKKHRSQMRKFEAAGGFRRVEARGRAETDRLLDTFFEMKTVRLARMGVRDVFADAGTRAFFRDLFGAVADRPRPDFVLHGLEIGGRLRAVTGCSRTTEGLVCEFGAIAEDELAIASPGDFLFFENIREACAQGLAVYDFSVGDETYKRQWCNVETQHFDVLLPLTPRGRLAAGLFGLASEAKRRLKASPALWALVRRLRRRDV